MSRLLASLLAILGAALVVGLIWVTGPAVLVAEVRRAGWGIALLVIPWLLVGVACAEGWRWAVIAAYPGPPPDVLRGIRGASIVFLVRTGGETLNAVTPFFLGGEPVKVALLARMGVGAPEGAAGIVTSRTIQILEGAAFTAAGVSIIAAGSGGVVARAEAWLVAAGLMAAGWTLAIGLGLLLWQRKGLARGAERLLASAGLWPAALADRQDTLDRFDQAVARTYAAHPVALGLCAAWLLLGTVLGTLEVWLIFALLGRPVDLPSAVAIEVMAGVVKGTTSFIPGSVGPQEGGYTAVAMAFGHPASAGLSFALLRRAREILWVAVGAAILWGLHIRTPRPGLLSARLGGARVSGASR